MKVRVRRASGRAEGQSVIEYGLLLALIALFIVTMATAARERHGALASAAAVTARR